MRLPPELHFLTTDVGLARVCWPSFRHIEADDDGTLLCSIDYFASFFFKKFAISC